MLDIHIEIYVCVPLIISCIVYNPQSQKALKVEVHAEGTLKVHFAE